MYGIDDISDLSIKKCIFNPNVWKLLAIFHSEDHLTFLYTNQSALVEVI